MEPESDENAIPDPVFSDRGFAHWPPVHTTYGEIVSVYESSSATRECMWLALNGEAFLTKTPKPLPGVGFGTAEGHIAAHCTMEQAVAIRNCINAWIERHS